MPPSRPSSTLTTLRRAIAVCSGLFFASGAIAQEPPVKQGEKLAQIHDVAVAVQKTPDFTLKGGGTTDKRWRQKDWIEIEPEITFSPPKGAAGNNVKTIPSVELKYYVYLEAAGKDRRILTADVTHLSVPVGERVKSVVYITPSTILRISGRPEGSVQMVKGIGIEITMGGEPIGFYSVVNGKKSDRPGKDSEWWKSMTIPKEPELKNKLQTPFAPLWGDYHLDVQAK